MTYATIKLETAEHDHRQHDAPVLRRTVGAAKLVGDGPNFVRELLMLLCNHDVSVPPPMPSPQGGVLQVNPAA
jgi:hypothetical protein